MLLFVTAVAVVLVVSFLCSIFESVLLSLTRPQIEVMVSARQRAGSLLAGFKENMDVPIAAILILNTAAHTIGAAVAGASYSAVFDPATLWIFSILFTIAVLLFTEIIPKTLGVAYAQVLATPVAWGIHVLSRVLWPLVVASEKMSRTIRGDVTMPVTSAEEIRLLAVLGKTEGAVGPRTAGVIVGAAQLPILQARDIMLPRDQVQFLSGTMTRSQAVEYVRKSGHSRFPFSPTENLDDVNGVVLVKQLLDWLLEHDDEQIDWPALTHQILMVPETLSLPKLLHTYQQSHRHLALVVDEYGGVEGLATLEDVLEEIVGDIRDESDLPADDIRENADGSLLVKGSVDLRRLSAKLGVVWQPQHEVASIGGLVTEKLEKIPLAGEAISWSGYRIEVIRANRTRALWLRIVKED
ncbi:MAG: hemolysin family protein [Woeseiaceae bacterium]|nr:hemolysin family protein [Woeseiaceae bacterium]